MVVHHQPDAIDSPEARSGREDFIGASDHLQRPAGERPSKVVCHRGGFHQAESFLEECHRAEFRRATCRLAEYLREGFRPEEVRQVGCHPVACHLGGFRLAECYQGQSVVLFHPKQLEALGSDLEVGPRPTVRLQGMKARKARPAQRTIERSDRCDIATLLKLIICHQVH